MLPNREIIGHIHALPGDVNHVAATVSGRSTISRNTAFVYDNDKVSPCSIMLDRQHEAEVAAMVEAESFAQWSTRHSPSRRRVWMGLSDQSQGQRYRCNRRFCLDPY